jgi:hypothetical protein
VKRKNPSIANPDELNKHLQHSSPLTWVILGVVIALLAAFFTWSALGTVRFKLSGKASVLQGEATLVVETKDRTKLALGQKVVINGKEGSITSLTEETAIAGPFELADGDYSYYVVLAEKHPIEFFFGK